MARTTASAAHRGGSPQWATHADPGRTASTAAALMIGIALVTFVGVLAQGLRVSNSDAIEEQIQADLVVTSQDGYSEFPAAVGDAAARIEGTDVVSNVRQDVSEVDKLGANLTELDRSSINQVYSFRWAGCRTRCWRTWATTERLCRAIVHDDKDLAVGRLVHRADDGQQAREVRRPRDLQKGAPSTRCSAPRASRRTARRAATTGHATGSPSINAPRRPRRGAEGGRGGAGPSRASPTRASRPGRSGSTRRTKRSASSCSCCTSSLPCR